MQTVRTIVTPEMERDAACSDHARVIPAARTLDSSVDCRTAGISLILRAAANLTPWATLRAYQSALRAAGINRS